MSLVSIQSEEFDLLDQKISTSFNMRRSNRELLWHLPG